MHVAAVIQLVDADLKTCVTIGVTVPYMYSMLDDLTEDADRPWTVIPGLQPDNFLDLRA